jgi:hypothetical protein
MSDNTQYVTVFVPTFPPPTTRTGLEFALSGWLLDHACSGWPGEFEAPGGGGVFDDDSDRMPRTASSCASRYAARTFASRATASAAATTNS